MLLDRLAAVNLVQSLGRDRYQLHDLLREYAGELVTDDESRPAVTPSSATCASYVALGAT
jgi:hypothetical protein